MDNTINKILDIQTHAWSRGHDNYGSTIDVKADMLRFLKYFGHLNQAQKALKHLLDQEDELKYAKKLCSRAHKAVRHYIVTLK